MTAVRALRVAAGAEAVSLAVLLLNLATVHADAVSALAGPVHGTAYLAVIATARPVPPARRWSLLPGVGGLLATRIATAHATAAAPADPRSPSR
ncbi:DUF3817 domain-containing protein [Streptomyces johnsoniae]|uniref:DUF3817 domain-containing protein n=1 Tax=Streptomyces johnsoniae TaxID=3075532 RepID=UPI00374E1C45